MFIGMQKYKKTRDLFLFALFNVYLPHGTKFFNLNVINYDSKTIVEDFRRKKSSYCLG